MLQINVKNCNSAKMILMLIIWFDILLLLIIKLNYGECTNPTYKKRIRMIEKYDYNQWESIINDGKLFPRIWWIMIKVSFHDETEIEIVIQHITKRLSKCPIENKAYELIASHQYSMGQKKIGWFHA